MSTYRTFLEHLGPKYTKKIDTFAQIDTLELTIFVTKKVVFFNLLKIIWSCSEAVWGVFLALKAQILVYFQIGRSII